MIAPTAELTLALRLADSARTMAMEGWRTATLEKNKSAAGFDPVTPYDIAIEKMMHRHIRQAFPAHGIEGEELAQIAAADSTQPRWVLDPIDGTRNYFAGSLFWGVLIALLDGEGCPLFGIIDHPPTQERFYADKKTGLWVGGAGQTRALKTRDTKNIKEMVLGATTPQMFETPAELECFNRISTEAAITLYGGNCYFYGLLALGQMDGVIEASLQPYDIAALQPIVEAGGGVMTDWQGNPPLSGSSGRVVASANPHIHDKLLKKLSL